MDRHTYLEELKKRHSNNLQQIELQAAEYGTRPPLELVNHIEETKQKIQEIDNELRVIPLEESKSVTNPVKERNVLLLSIYFLLIIGFSFLMAFILVNFFGLTEPGDTRVRFFSGVFILNRGVVIFLIAALFSAFGIYTLIDRYK